MNMLVDAGSSDVKEVGRYRVLPFLKSQGIRKLDYVLMTHADADHISGIRELMQLNYPIRCLLPVSYTHLYSGCFDPEPG